MALRHYGWVCQLLALLHGSLALVVDSGNIKARCFGFFVCLSGLVWFFETSFVCLALVALKFAL